MIAILPRIHEVAVRYNFTMYLYIALANQQEEYGKGGAMSAILRRICELAVHSKLDTEQFRNVQAPERYIIPVSCTKKNICQSVNPFPFIIFKFAHTSTRFIYFFDTETDRSARNSMSSELPSVGMYLHEELQDELP